MTATAPTTVAELRAEMAEGCRRAAAVYRQSGLVGADALAERLDRDAERNDRLAKEAAQ